MKTVNRSVAIVRPREPYIQWALSVDDGAQKDEASLRSQVSVYLVPPDPKGEEEAAPIASWYAAIFDIELDSWYSDTGVWPQRRDLKTFREWFDVTLDSVVVDLGKGPIEHEEW